MSTASLSIVYDQPIAMTSKTAPVGLAELYERHYDAVFRAALRVTGNSADAEDALQTVFLRILKQEERSRWPRPRRPTSAARPRTLRSTSSAAASGRRKRPSTASAAVGRGKPRASQTAPAAGPRPARAEDAELFVLKYVEGFSSEELAAMFQHREGHRGSGCFGSARLAARSDRTLKGRHTVSEDRLEQTLHEMKNESVPAEDAEAARARVWADGECAGAGWRSCGRTSAPYLPAGSASARRPDGRPPEPLHRLSARDGRVEGRKVGRSRCRRWASSRCGRDGDLPRRPSWSLGPLSRPRPARRHDGPLRSARHGCRRGRRPLPAAAGRAQAAAAISDGEMVRTGHGAHAVFRLADGSLGRGQRTNRAVP